jgi:hypothetical protein
VLAQLQQRPDVETAEVDRRGERLRIGLRPGGTVSAIRDDLERMGFGAAEAADSPIEGASWYGPSDVGELSREEGEVIAARVVPPFAASYGLDGDRRAALETRVAAALHACFTDRTEALVVSGGISAVCGPAVEGATAPLIGARLAGALARAIESDLSGHR